MSVIYTSIYTAWPKVCGQPKITPIWTVTVEHLIPKPWALICCCTSLHSSGQALHKTLDPRCRDLLSFSHKSISEVGALMSDSKGWLTVGAGNSSQRCWMGLRSGLCAGQSSSSTPVRKSFLMAWGSWHNCCHKERRTLMLSIYLSIYLSSQRQISFSVHPARISLPPYLTLS